jgi:hypothetical protein
LASIFRFAEPLAHSVAKIGTQEETMRFDVNPDALDLAAQNIRWQAATLGTAPSAASLKTVAAVNDALERLDEMLRENFDSAREGLTTVANALGNAATTYRANEDALAAATQVGP